MHPQNILPPEIDRALLDFVESEEIPKEELLHRLREYRDTSQGFFRSILLYLVELPFFEVKKHCGQVLLID